MRNGFLISLASLALATGVASAQDVPMPKAQLDIQKQPDVLKQPAIKQVEPGPGPLVEVGKDRNVVLQPGPVGGMPLGSGPVVGDGCGLGCCDDACGYSCWGSIEYLNWRIKRGPVPAPLVTTGNPNDGPLAGTLGQPDTRVLFGGSTLDFGNLSGGRLTLGSWVGCDRCFGVEANVWQLERGQVDFFAQSNATGTPPIYVPAFNIVLNREDSLIVADPVQRFAGSVQWTAQTRLWGTELNGVWAAGSGCNWEATWLGGIRYMDLRESLQLDNTTTDLVNQSVASLSERFATRNQFYGAQVGGRVGWCWDCFSLTVTGKLAFGSTHQSSTVDGNITQSGGGGLQGTFPGGFFSQPTNLTVQSRNAITCVPELDFKVGCDILPGVHLFVGYDLVYWNSVIRPGSQIDRNLNLSQSPIFGPGSLTGPPRPTPLFNETDFWANGVSVGLELRY